MPIINIQHIVSFSSEDKIHKAENLLRKNSQGKWRCAKSGESQAVVVMQLEKATRINSIDIGNDGSAFVEVLVSRSSNDQDYQVLLVASSFMTPTEARSGNGSNKVRMFSEDQLSSEIAKQSWNRVKLVCTQPFNKHTTYGLSFINLHSKENEEKSQSPETTSSQLQSASSSRTSFGKFKLKAVDPVAPPSVRNVAMKVETQTFNQAKLGPKIKVEEKTKPGKVSEPQKRKMLSETSTKPKHQKTNRAATDVAFNKLLSDVVFVISGFQNPRRSDLRDKALSMGARYRRDWETGCTHLICAFANTPKFRQVMGDPRGRIVRADWIIDCAAQKKRLPCKPYSMDPNTSDNDDVDDGKPPDDIDDPIEASTDEEDDVIDTDDEIERVKQNIKIESPGAPPVDPYDVSTDDEEEPPVTSSDGIPELPDYFSGKTFFLYGDFPPVIERMLKRHIITCDGTLEEYMSDDVRYVVTQRSWDSSFDDALTSNSSLVFVKPSWVFECGHSKSLLPHSRHIVHSN
uniref:DNA repair protein XRCC1-like n=1 Tax=Phallusia mammillata TaxID=59560 RepID=A0A6F9DWK7_9ASCI|nr:DNA repair protein XRCC1-like [Phallusia mammillata]